MPELPEVESAARDLARWTRGRTIVRASAGERPVRLLAGRSVEAVTRRGKWIVVRLSGDAGLGLHLGMTGDLALAAARERPRFSRAVLTLDDGSRVHFVDARRFGRFVAVARHDDLLAMPALASQGPDALTELTPALLRDGLRSARAVKVALLDQTVAAGIGNVYAGDALFEARIHPAVPARDVAGDSVLVRRLVSAIRSVLRKGLARYEAGSPRDEGSDEELYPGSIYGRAGQPCPRCRRPIESMTLGGRTTVFCARCQPA